MKFKREKITQATLDEMARTMSVIPSSELMSMLGEGGTTIYIGSKPELDCYLNRYWYLSASEDQLDQIEAAFYRFKDGTYAVYIDDANGWASMGAGWKNYCWHPLTYIWGSSNSGIYFEGKEIDMIGHTHFLSSDLGSNDILSPPNGYDGPLATFSIYYAGLYFSY